MAIIQKNPPSTERILGWIGLLTLAQLADLLTTHLDMNFGAVEGNQIAATLLQQGGLWYLWAVKLLLVIALFGVAACFWLNESVGSAAGFTPRLMPFWKATLKPLGGLVAPLQLPLS